IGYREILGGQVVCVSCWDREKQVPMTVSHPQGVDPRFLKSVTDQYGTIDKSAAAAAGYVIEDGDAWLAKDVDVLIPSALEGQINAETVGKISDRVRMVAEGANGPTTPEADEVFRKNNVFVIPDFLCNAGGVTVSYFESVQNDMNYYWTGEDVLKRLDVSMTRAFDSVLKMAVGEGVFMRDAAYMVAIEKVVKAMEMRGWL
ncbi:MAG TPA: glutamate dehydrogenase, partial [Anaerolineales bacterium]|nr:glutamate dehydrogenase [Anaerolineales bacterium]